MEASNIILVYYNSLLKFSIFETMERNGHQMEQTYVPTSGRFHRTPKESAMYLCLQSWSHLWMASHLSLNSSHENTKSSTIHASGAIQNQGHWCVHTSVSQSVLPKREWTMWQLCHQEGRWTERGHVGSGLCHHTTPGYHLHWGAATQTTTGMAPPGVVTHNSA